MAAVDDEHFRRRSIDEFSMTNSNGTKPQFTCDRLGRGEPRARRGVSTLWMVAWLPVMLIFFCILVNVGNLWLARIEAETALEAAALAAVKEWGDNNGGSTLVPRQVGIAYANGNTVRCERLKIATNYDSAASGSNPNENLMCDVVRANPATSTLPNGNLIFGALVEDDPLNPLTFNTGIEPSCGIGTVMIDATGEGNLAADNAWGIAFHITPDTPATLRIVSVTIDLQASGESGTFDFSTAGPELSDNVAPHALVDNSSNTQPDIEGFSDPAAQITFVPTGGSPSSLTINFAADPGAGIDDGFAPGDRFRFGARIGYVSMGTGGDDGDGIGQDGVQVTVTFNVGSPVTAIFADNRDRKKDCFDTAQVEPLSGSLIVHPTGTPNLPCPATSSPANNGQSFVTLPGSGGRNFLVRAQAEVPVKILCASLFSGSASDVCVTAKATAVYNCDTHRVSLIRVDRYICPGP